MNSGRMEAAPAHARARRAVAAIVYVCKTAESPGAKAVRTEDHMKDVGGNGVAGQ